MLDYHCINGLSDISLLKHRDITLTDSTKGMCKFIRLLSSYMLVAPVCRQREKRSIRVYGEEVQVKLFQSIINKIQRYQNDNGLINLMESAKSVKVREVSTHAHYLRERDKVYKWLTDPEPWGFMNRSQRAEYQYKLLLNVAKIENLIPDKHTNGGLNEFDLGWHVSYHKFQNKKILTTKCIKGVI